MQRLGIEERCRPLRCLRSRGRDLAAPSPAMCRPLVCNTVRAAQILCKTPGPANSPWPERRRLLPAHGVALVRRPIHTDCTMRDTGHVTHLPASAATTAALRHVAATLAYRAAKILRDVPAGFDSMAFGPATRAPVQIVAHMADLMAWGISLARGEYVWKAEGGSDWNVEVQRFFEGLAQLDATLSSGELPEGAAEKLIQGPLADALTHAGQLAMLRGMAGHPVRPESYARADITAGRVGLDQPPPRREFDGDASARR